MAEATWASADIRWRTVGHAALIWWWRELSGLVPPAFTSHLGGLRGSALKLDFAMTEASLTLDRPQELPATIIPIPSDNPAKASLDRLHLAGSAVEIRLHDSLLFRTTIDLPLAAEGSMEPILRNQLARIVPLDPTAVRFVWQVVERMPTKQRVSVELCLLKQETLDRALQLAATLELVPISATVPGMAKGTATIWQQTHAIGNGKRDRLVRRGLEFLSIFFLVCCYFTLASRQDAQLSSLRELVSERTAQAAAIAPLRRKTESEERLLEAVEQHLCQPSALAVINALTQALPLDSSISEFHLQHGKVEIIGIAPHATAILGAIEKSPLLTNAGFEAPITQAPNGGGDRFDLSAHIIPNGKP